MSSATGATPPPGDPGTRAGSGRRDATGHRGASGHDGATGSGRDAWPDAADTIVAAASAAGFGERAIVRLSGTRARELAAAVIDLRPATGDAEALTPGRVTPGSLDLGDGVRCPLELLAFRAPASATGEDVVEVHLQGWPVLVNELLRRCVEAGARPAARGEFTARAVVLGRLTPDEALAVGRLTLAEDADEASAAVAVLTGEVAAGRAALRAALLDALALIEAHVDFEEEDTEGIDAVRLRDGLATARRLAERLHATASALPARDGETDVVLLGPPNAGKSSLLAALCPGTAPRVSPRPGTTRDMLEASVRREGRAFRLLDGPGVAADDAALGELDRHAARRFAALLPVAAVVLDVEDATAPASPAEREHRAALAAGRRVVRVDNKLDLPDAPRGGRRPDALPVSALTGEGLDALWRALVEAAPRPRAPDLADRTLARAVAGLLPVLAEAEAGDLDGALPVLALGLRDAVARLDDGDEGGADLVDEVLERIYATFCVGK